MNPDPFASLMVCVWCGGEGRVSITKTNNRYRGCRSCEKFSYPARTRGCKILTNNKTGKVVSLDWHINEPQYPNRGAPDAPIKEAFTQHVVISKAKAWSEAYDSERPEWIWNNWVRPLPDPSSGVPIADQIQEIFRFLKTGFVGNLSDLQKAHPYECPQCKKALDHSGPNPKTIRYMTLEKHYESSPLCVVKKLHTA